MKKLLGAMILWLLICSASYSQNLSEQLIKLEGLYERGTITKEEFTKAKSILLKMDASKNEASSQTEITKDMIKVNTFRDHIKEFEKKELIFGDYRIYTHRPGGVKIRRLSDNKQLAVFSDKFKIKYYHDGEGLFDFVLDEQAGKIFLSFKGVEIIKWEGQFVKKHNAHFFQIITTNDEAFHYYIVLDGGRVAALNIKKFEKKIAKSVDKVKIRLAAKYNITLEQIELILKKRKDAKNKELEKAIGKKKKEILDEALKDSLQDSLESELAKQLEETIGEAMAKEFQSAIIEGMEDELIAAVNEAVAEAVSAGISEAAAEAGIRAALEVLAAGGSEQDAWDAGCAAAGEEKGC